MPACWRSGLPVRSRTSPPFDAAGVGGASPRTATCASACASSSSGRLTPPARFRGWVSGGGPRDLARLRDALFAARDLGTVALAEPAKRARIGRPGARPSTCAADELAAALADDLPPRKRDGGFIRPGYALELDELRELQRDSRRFIAALQARYAAETGCRTLRVKHNHMIGYFVEVPQNVGEDLLGRL